MVRQADGSILLADEISPDNCRLWDDKTNEKMDKDVFRRDLGSLTDAYEKILAKTGGQIICIKLKYYITLKESVLDPQGMAVKHSLHSLTYNEVSDARIGKYIGIDN